LANPVPVEAPVGKCADRNELAHPGTFFGRSFGAEDAEKRFHRCKTCIVR